MVIETKFLQFSYNSCFDFFKEDKHINIGMSCSISYLYKSIACFNSVLKKITKKLKINIFILSTDNMNVKITERFVNFLNTFKKNIYLYFINVDKLKYQPNNKDNNYWTSDSFLRLFFCHKFFKNLSKIIFLDCDTIVNFNIYKMWKKKIKKTIIGVKDYQLIHFCKTNSKTISNLADVIKKLGSNNFFWKDYFKYYLKINYENYINAGFFILDIEKTIKKKIWERITNFLDLKNPIFMDQCALNFAFHNEIQYVSKKYNYFPIYSDYNILNFLYKKKIIHFAGSPKPWQLGFNQIFLYWKKFLKNILSKNLIQENTFNFVYENNISLMKDYKKRWKKFYLFFFVKRFFHLFKINKLFSKN